MMTKLHHKVAYLAITLSLALAVWLMPAMKAAAAETNIATVDPMRTLFSAEYYAEKNRDVAEKYGNDADALYAHFLRYGIAEERENLSPAIDLVAYKAANPDLQAAFGDDWKAYWKHYVIHGVREIANGQRIATGTKFFAKAYAEAYPDVVAVLGSDPASLLWHYCHYGYAENRTKGTAYATKSRSNTSNVSNTQSASSNASADAGKEDTSGNSPSEKPGGDTGEKPGEKPEEKPSEQPVGDVEIGSSDSETATVSAEVYQQLESGKATAVVMKNTAGTIKLPLAALRAAGGANAQIVAKQYNEVLGATNGTVTDAEGNVIDVANAVGIEVKLQNGDTEKKVSGLADAEQIQIAVPKPENLDTSVELDAYYVNGDGKLELMGPVTIEGDTLTFKTSHLTQFIILARKHTLTLEEHTYTMFAKGQCKICGKLAHEKDYLHYVKKDFTVENGTRCGVCGKTLEEFQKEHAKIDINEHKTEYPLGGNNPKRYCDVCGVEILEHVHSFVPTDSTVEGICVICFEPCPETKNHDGKVICPVCGIADHIPGENWFTEDGGYHWKVCVRTSHSDLIYRGPHVYNEVTEDGQTIKTCKVCGRKEVGLKDDTIIDEDFQSIEPEEGYEENPEVMPVENENSDENLGASLGETTELQTSDDP